jgi:hypothetical protein
MPGLVWETNFVSHTAMRVTIVITAPTGFVPADFFIVAG